MASSSDTSGSPMEVYAKYVEEMGDSRVTDWYMMQSPHTVVLICILYLCFCNVWGPRFMKDRKPFEMKKAMMAYNASNVALSSWVLYESLMSGWWRDYSYRCQPMDYSPKGLRMARMAWVYFLCKIYDMIDTVFFVLRKKDRQVTYLHLYHHTTMPLLCWLSVKFIPGGHGTFPYLLNSFVHVVMYGYYLLAALGPEFQKYLWWKKYLTTLQLVQFILVTIHAMQLLIFECDYPKFVNMLGMLNGIYFFYLFMTFYSKEYSGSGKKAIGKRK